MPLIITEEVAINIMYSEIALVAEICYKGIHSTKIRAWTKTYCQGGGKRRIIPFFIFKSMAIIFGRTRGEADSRPQLALGYAYLLYILLCSSPVILRLVTQDQTINFTRKPVTKKLGFLHGYLHNCTEQRMCTISFCNICII